MNIISNSSPIIALNSINRLDILGTLFRTYFSRVRNFFVVSLPGKTLRLN